MVRSDFQRQREKAGRVPTARQLRERSSADVLRAWLPESLYAMCGLEVPLLVGPTLPLI